MKRLLLSAACLLILMYSFGQNRTITGKITDEAGSGLSSVSVVVKGEKKGTSTNNEGEFSISLQPGNKRLVISSVGFVAREVAVANQTAINVQLVPENKGLDEVVVVGYGTKTVRENTGAIGKVSGSKLSSEPLPTFTQALAGKTAGVQVSMNGGSLAGSHCHTDTRGELHNIFLPAPGGNRRGCSDCQ